MFEVCVFRHHPAGGHTVILWWRGRCDGKGREGGDDDDNDGGKGDGGIGDVGGHDSGCIVAVYGDGRGNDGRMCLCSTR